MSEALRDVFAEARRAYTVDDVWGMLGLPGVPKPSCSCPWRDDRNPSFSIHSEKRKWKDHATGESGDIIDLVMKVLDIDHAEARLWFMERLGIDKPEPRKCEPVQPPPKEIKWPGGFVETSPAITEAFGKSMGLSYAGAHVLSEAGLLRYLKQDGVNCYAVTDPSERVAEIRRMDGGTWNGRKQFPLAGVDKRWPVGAHYLVGARADAGVILTEGATDFLTAFDCLVACRRAKTKPPRRWLPVALLGAGCKRLHPELHPWIRGRVVRLVPDGDEAGDKMRDHWGELLTDLDCTVETVVMPRGKDLSDVVQNGELKPEGLFA